MVIDYTHKNTWLRPFKNGGKLLMGRTTRGVLSVGYLAFATRALGVEGFGTLTIIYSTIMFLRNVLGFQSWQMLLRFGSKAIEQRDGNRLLQLTLFAGAAELTAALLGVVFMFLFTPLLLAWFSLPAEAGNMLRLFSLSLFMLLGADVFMGILRLLDEHNAISRNIALEAIFRFIGAALAMVYSPTLWTFMLVWFSATVLSQAVFFSEGIKALKKQVKTLRKSPDAALRKPLKKNLYKAPEAGLWRYLGGTSIDYSIGAGMVHLTPLLVALVLGPMSVGVYNVAQRCANIIDDLVQKVLISAIYTDMAWLSASGNTEKRKQMVLRTGALTGAFSLAVTAILAVFGRKIITFIAGAEFNEAYPVMLVLTLASTIPAATFALEPLLMTAGKLRSVIFSRLLSLATYGLLLVPLTHAFGILGAAYALATRHAVFAGYAAWAGYKLLKADPSTPHTNTKKGDA